MSRLMLFAYVGNEETGFGLLLRSAIGEELVLEVYPAWDWSDALSNRFQY